MAGSDPRKLFAPGAKLPEKYEYITATGDSLLIDLAGNQVILMGNVKVDEERSGVTCERMTIFLDRKGAGSRARRLSLPPPELKMRTCGGCRAFSATEMW